MIIKTVEISKTEAMQILEREKVCILATCAGNRVTIRQMSHINDGLTLYFQTGENSLKMSQMRENPRVAVSVGGYDMEGVATECGHPLEVGNEFFANAYKEKHPGSFEAYSSLSDEVLVRVDINSARQWRYVDGQPYIAEGKF